jgi:hypothetical protein
MKRLVLLAILVGGLLGCVISSSLPNAHAICNGGTSCSDACFSWTTWCQSGNGFWFDSSPLFPTGVIFGGCTNGRVGGSAGLQQRVPYSRYSTCVPDCAGDYADGRNTTGAPDGNVIQNDSWILNTTCVGGPSTTTRAPARPR